MYKVFVKDTSTSAIYELPLQKASYTEQLNRGVKATFEFDYKTVEEAIKAYSQSVLFLFSAAKREIWIEKSSTKIFYGLISDLGIQRKQDGGLSCNVAAVDFLQILAKRRTGAKRIFSSTDAGTIAWTLIDESQTSDNPYSDLGITSGSITASVNRDRTFRFANLLEEIFQMSSENLKNGFDCDVDTLKKFNVYYPTKGSNRDNIFLDEKNIVSWQYRKPLIMSLANKVYVLGEGFNDDVLYSNRTSSTTYRSTWGTLEEILSERDVKVSQTLDDKGDKYLEKNQAPAIELELEHVDDDPNILDYAVGDSLKVNLPEIDINNSLMRVYQRTVDIDENELGVITLLLK